MAHKCQWVPKSRQGTLREAPFQPHPTPAPLPGQVWGCTLCFPADVCPAFFLLGYFESSTVEIKRVSEMPGGLESIFFYIGLERIIFRSTQLFKEQIPDFLQQAHHSTSAVILSFPFFSLIPLE